MAAASRASVRNILVRTTCSGAAPASRSAAIMISKQRLACAAEDEDDEMDDEVYAPCKRRKLFQLAPAALSTSPKVMSPLGDAGL